MWKTTFLRDGTGMGDPGLESRFTGFRKSQFGECQKWAISRTVKGLSNRCSLDPLSGRTYYLSRLYRWDDGRLAVQAVRGDGATGGGVSCL